jgi:hypothetical protein
MQSRPNKGQRYEPKNEGPHWLAPGDPEYYLRPQSYQYQHSRQTLLLLPSGPAVRFLSELELHVYGLVWPPVPFLGGWNDARDAL